MEQEEPAKNTEAIKNRGETESEQECPAFASIRDFGCCGCDGEARCTGPILGLPEGPWRPAVGFDLPVA